MPCVHERIYRGTNKDSERITMAQMRDLYTGKVYIGPEDPKVDQSIETLDGDKEFEGTLASVGPVFLGEHSDIAFGHVNIGTDIGLQKFVPQMKGRALDVEGDVSIVGNGSGAQGVNALVIDCLLYTSPSPRDIVGSRMPSSA